MTTTPSEETTPPVPDGRDSDQVPLQNELNVKEPVEQYVDQLKQFAPEKIAPGTVEVKGLHALYRAHTANRALDTHANAYKHNLRLLLAASAKMSKLIGHTEEEVRSRHEGIMSKFNAAKRSDIAPITEFVGSYDQNVRSHLRAGGLVRAMVRTQLVRQFGAVVPPELAPIEPRLSALVLMNDAQYVAQHEVVFAEISDALNLEGPIPTADQAIVDRVQKQGKMGYVKDSPAEIVKELKKIVVDSRAAVRAFSEQALNGWLGSTPDNLDQITDGNVRLSDVMSDDTIVFVTIGKRIVTLSGPWQENAGERTAMSHIQKLLTSGQRITNVEVHRVDDMVQLLSDLAEGMSLRGTRDDGVEVVFEGADGPVIYMYERVPEVSISALKPTIHKGRFRRWLFRTKIEIHQRKPEFHERKKKKLILDSGHEHDVAFVREMLKRLQPGFEVSFGEAEEGFLP